MLIREEVIPHGDLGFFSHPLNFGDYVVKRYQGLVPEREVDELTNLHDSFIDDLRGIGVNIPPTDLKFISGGNGSYRIEIWQERLNPAGHAGERIKHRDRRDVLSTVHGILEDALLFIDSPLLGKRGFHPTTRNYVFKDDVPYYVDTFPPYGSNEQTKRLMIRHAPSLLMKGVMIAGQHWLDLYTQEYYNPSEMYSGIIASSCRLRPEYSPEIKELGRELLGNRTVAWKKEAVRIIMRTSRKPLKWRLKDWVIT